MFVCVLHSDGLFGCFGNCGVCICSFFCPCVQYGRNVRILGDGEMVPNCAIFFCCLPFNCLCAGPKRTEMRNKYKLKVSSERACTQATRHTTRHDSNAR